MSKLEISPVFKEITSLVGGQVFSVMYFGHHCGRNILIVQHEVTVMLIFKKHHHSLTPDFIKSVSSKGIEIKGKQIVGNENVVLLLDEAGAVWRLINAFEFSNEKDECLYLLDDKRFYEWIPFKKFKLDKIFAISAWKNGFACVGIHKNSERRLVLLPSADSHIIKDYTFDEVRSSNSFNFYLINVKRNAEEASESDEVLILTDRLKGKTFLCSDGKENTLINYSNNFLVSILHFKQENCLLLCFQSGKLVFYFFNHSTKDCIAYLHKKISLIEKCFCSDSCLLWSDGIYLHHTKLSFQFSQPFVRLIQLGLDINIEKPISLVRLQNEILSVTMNDFYYLIRPGSDPADEIQREPEELLSEICQGSLRVHQLNKKIDEVTYFLSCKEILCQEDMQKKVEMSLEKSHLVIKLNVKVNLRKDFWKVRLTRSVSGQRHAKMVDLETDVSEGMLLRVVNPWGGKYRMEVSLIAHYDDESLFVGLGEVGEVEKDVNELSEYLTQIYIKRNPFYSKK